MRFRRIFSSVQCARIYRLNITLCIVEMRNLERAIAAARNGEVRPSNKIQKRKAVVLNEFVTFVRERGSGNRVKIINPLWDVSVVISWILVASVL